MKNHTWKAALAFAVVAVCGGAIRASEHRDWTSDPVCHTIFSAVLEGLYTDGVSNEDVDIILGVDPNTQKPNYTMHFVYACPLCLPALEAFRFYRGRPEFYARKESQNTFGHGLDETFSKRLHSTDRNTRMVAIQELIQKWVGKRLESMRLTAAEHEDWRAKLAALRKQGMDMLKRGGGEQYPGWKACAVCDACSTAGGNTCERPAMPFGELKSKEAIPAAKPKDQF